MKMKSVLIFVFVVVSCVYARFMSPANDEDDSQTRDKRDVTFQGRIPPNGYTKTTVGRDPFGVHGKFTIEDQLFKNPMGSLNAHTYLAGQLRPVGTKGSIGTKLNYTNGFSKATVLIHTAIRNGHYKYRLGGDLDLGRHTDLSGGVGIDANRRKMDVRVLGRVGHFFS